MAHPPLHDPHSCYAKLIVLNIIKEQTGVQPEHRASSSRVWQDGEMSHQESSAVLQQQQFIIMLAAIESTYFRTCGIKEKVQS